MSGRKVKRREGGLPSLKQGPPSKPRMVIAGMAGQRDYAQLRIAVLARPQGGEVARLGSGQLKLIRPGLCERCGRAPATDPHHRKLTAQGGPDRASNLAALCRPCHNWCHAHPDDAILGGWIVRANDDFTVRAILVWDGSIVLLDDEAGYSFQKWPDGGRAVPR